MYTDLRVCRVLCTMCIISITYSCTKCILCIKDIAELKKTIVSLNCQIQSMLKTHEEMMTTSKEDKLSFEKSQETIVSDAKREERERERERETLLVLFVT